MLYYVLNILLAKNDFVLYVCHTLNADFQGNHELNISVSSKK